MRTPDDLSSPNHIDHECRLANRQWSSNTCHIVRMKNCREQIKTPKLLGAVTIESAQWNQLVYWYLYKVCVAYTIDYKSLGYELICQW